MADQPMFTEACLDTSVQHATRRETLTLLNTRLHPALQKIVAAEVASDNRVSDAASTALRAAWSDKPPRAPRSPAARA